ncbi:major facilitator superfamily domain-containing protein 12-like [Planococcus citri]|uniref:major facilitator superfamily domain-containing protein 12-like n=1 Tax=Planococcus citri TaxID=170843 RepID=UPI0031F81883
MDSMVANPEKKLSHRVLISYGFGHILNDLTASMWFSYLLIFFHYVLNFTSSFSGILLLIGQIADGIATPIIGILSDKGAGHWLCRYGHRKTWHLIGTLCVISSFPFIFSPCFGFRDVSNERKICYYSIFIIIFQFGWASVQVSHLSLVPDLTPSQSERTNLLTIRYSCTVLANIVTHLFTWLMFLRNGKSEAVVGSADGQKFQTIALFAAGVGFVCSLIFHLGIEEKTGETLLEKNDNFKDINKKKVLSQLTLYHSMAVYMMTQLFVNQSQVFIPLYLEEYLHIEAQRLPVLPLIMYISSSLTSVLTKSLNNNCGRRPAYFTGALLAILACVPIYFGQDAFYKAYMIYIVVILFGCASSIVSVTSLGITADLIGDHTKHGAFVYGMMSFGDKISNGVAVMIIQYLKHYNTASSYYRDILLGMCGGSAVVGLIFVIFLPSNFELFKKERQLSGKNNVMMVYCLENETNKAKPETSS